MSNSCLVLGPAALFTQSNSQPNKRHIWLWTQPFAQAAHMRKNSLGIVVWWLKVIIFMDERHSTTKVSGINICSELIECHPTWWPCSVWLLEIDPWPGGGLLCWYWKANGSIWLFTLTVSKATTLKLSKLLYSKNENETQLMRHISATISAGESNHQH